MITIGFDPLPIIQYTIAAMTKKKTTTKKKPLTQKKKKSPVVVKPSTRRTSKVKSVKSPTPVKPVKKQRKPKNDINAQIDRLLAGIVENPKPIPKPKRTRNLSMKELERKIDKIVREALKQKPKKEKKQ